MGFLKSHRGAMAAAAVVIALSVLFGFHRSATAARADVEALFYTGADGSGYSIAADLEARQAVAANLLTVAGRYLDAGSIAGLSANLDELKAAEGPAEKYFWNAALTESAELVLSELEQCPLTEKDAQYVRGFRADLASRADTIARDPYNRLVDQFNQEKLGVFPANLLKHVAFVREAEAFR